MRRKAMIVVGAGCETAAAARSMAEHKIGALRVVDGEALVGIIMTTDFVPGLVALEERAVVQR
jgi:CBS domain-containing protein